MPDRALGRLAWSSSAARGPFAGADAQAFAAGFAAMDAGCRFLMARAADGAAFGSPPVIAVRRACNCLKELDRFLMVLIDALAAEHGAPHGARVLYVRDGDAAARLSRIKPLRYHFAFDLPRLRAIGRLRALALGDAPAEAASRPMADLALATMGHDIADQACGACFALGDQTLAQIAAFYLALAERLRDLLIMDAPIG